MRHVLLSVCLLGATLPLPSAWAGEPVRIGVVAHRPRGQTLGQWEPLAAALKQVIPTHDFVVRPLTFEEMDLAVVSRQLDFVLTNPSHYVLLARRGGLSAPLATLADNHNGQPGTVFGGVIFSRAEQTDISTLSDIRGKTIATVGTQSLGAYQMQAYELKRAGVMLPQDGTLISIGVPQDKVVEAVLAGRADVGFVRTGVLEAMAREGKLVLKNIKVLNQQDLPDFPVRVSTRLYPEWTFAALPHTEENLARRVAAALFQLEENTVATRAMGIHGFVIPADYSPVVDLLKELRLPPFDVTPAFTLRDVWSRYRWFIAAGALALGVILLLGMRLFIAQRKLALEHRLVLQQKQELQSSEFRWKFAIEDAGAGLWDWNLVDNTVFLSPSWKQMLGYADHELGNDVAQWESRYHPEDRVDALAIRQEALDGKKMIYAGEHRVHCKDGSTKWVRDRGSVVNRSADGKPLRMIGTQTDISERKTWEDSLRQLAHFDVLTGLPNRALFSDRLQQALAQTQRRGQSLAVAYLDLDGFKTVNDRYGHDAGDHLLKTLAWRLKQALREGDTLARVGGDEFIAVLIDVSDLPGCEPLLGRLLAAAAQPVRLAEFELQVSASIGLTFYPQAQDVDVEALLRQADQAMYQAKLAGKNCYRVFGTAPPG